MAIHRLRSLLPAALIFCSSLACGQAARSPFSSYGLGDTFGTALAPAQGMGGVGISNPEYFYINNQNPALLVHNRLTTFQAGIIGEQRTQVASELSEKSGSGNLNYLVMGIPIKPGKWGTALGLMPYTRLNYMLKYTAPIEGSTSRADITEEGTGGVNQFYFSNGYKITRRVSVGLKTAYLFSAAAREFTAVVNQPNQIFLLYPKVRERTFVSDFQFSPGISIHYDSISRKNYEFNFGLVYDFRTNLNTDFEMTAQRLNLGGAIVDSTTLIPNTSGIIAVPSAISGGLSFGRSYYWMAAVDASYAFYSSEYRDLTGANPYGKDFFKLGAGFSYTPDPFSLSNYLKRVTYRTGVSYENYPYLVNGNAVKDFGITFGVSVPVSRVSSLDLALKVGKKGDKALNTIEENYLKLYFGITFNDQWFIKRRFD